ncbi:serine/threonine protein kinase [Trichophyton tonsurans CBS 112818]|uniref:Serine/threonine protein kinase n=1 Tax=Trichophyton tonsurans (strain CBS 112818) TaxID=647933 RepID=F2S350_TRIT1|nr:serine/threonine protein kinase [Trichophyton tonsurans CBS 112818]
MDQLTSHILEKKVKEFIDSIEPSLVCELASSLHPEKKSCKFFSDPKKGSYNVCFPIVFTEQVPNAAEPASTQETTERWMIRVPLLPRLAFPEEKLRSEIATMKFIAEKTTIPIPRLYHYSINQDNILNLPFMAVEFITGNTLHGRISKLPEEREQHLYGQLADIYLQLHRHQFDRIGALTLDSNDENWVFEHNRPLTIELNDQELSGMKSSEIIPAHQTYSSTIDYVYTVMKLVFNDFYRSKDSVFNETDARNYLYGIFASQGIVMEWVDERDNHGPFFLMHGDLRPPNIFVDDDLNIISVIDWEWSHTIPSQMFIPPSWICGQELPAATRRPYQLVLDVCVSRFQRAAREQEHQHYNPDKKLKFFLPLVKLWNRHLKSEKLFIAYALLQPCYLGNVYWNLLDNIYHGTDGGERVDSFYKLKVRKRQEEELQRVLSDLEAYKKELALAGLEPIQPTAPLVLKPAEGNDSNTLSKSGEDADSTIYRIWKKLNIKNVISPLHCWIPCSLVGVSVIACCIIAKRRR